VAYIARRRLASGEYRYDLRYRTGSKMTTETFRRRKDAEARQRKVEADELAGILLDPKQGRVGFETYANDWLKTRLVKGRPLAPMTVEGYRGLLRRNLVPHFHDMPLLQITPDRVREWYAKVASDAGQNQAGKSYRLLRAILNTAVEEDILARNPCRIRSAGNEQSDERPLVEAAFVMELAEAIDPYLRALVLLAGFAGLRTGEMLGLRRRDIDLLRRQATVRLQAQQIIGQGRVVREPKSEAGKRTVALPLVVIEALELHLSKYVGPSADAFVFVGPRGKPLLRNVLSRRWQAACRAVGAPEGLRIHDLRHHAATLAARMPGITTKELMARIGHGSSRAALIYQHATEKRDHAVAAYIDDAVQSADPPRLGDVRPMPGVGGDSAE
jgi:integrase